MIYDFILYEYYKRILQGNLSGLQILILMKGS